MNSTSRNLRSSADKSPDLGPSWFELSQSRRERRSRFGLAARLSCYFLLISITALGTTAWWLAERNAATARNDLADVAQTSAQSMAIAGRVALAGGDVATLRALANGVVGTGDQRERGMSATFVDASGTPIATSDGASLPFERALAVNVPVINGTRTIGAVSISVGTGGVNEARRATLQAFGVVGAGIVGGALLLVLLYVKAAFRPLNALAAAARRVTAGDIDAVVPVRGGDAAVFDLAVAFNELVAWVRGQRADLAAKNIALHECVSELERKVENRSAQLEAANERLHGEIAEKEDFLRAVSHDLNAPLRNIGGMVAMLMMKDKASLPPEVVGRLERIKKNVDIETDLINELLELSRIKTRRQNLEVVDTESVLWDLRGLFENDLKTRQIEIVLETSLPTLYAERARVRQIFLNLIDTAIKYMGDDKPRREVRIGCRVSVTEAEFYVADSGLGIHPEDLDKVFFVFRRGRGEVAQKVPGKGVGLASVKSIIETYAGRIWVQSKLGEGTTFLFTVNGKYVPSVSGKAPVEMDATDETEPTPTLSASSQAA